MIRVTAPSRLHFGLMSLAGEGTHWPDRHGQATLPARRFGSVGLMIDEPGLQLSVQAAAAWSADGPLADRALRFARRMAESSAVPPHRIVVEHAPPEHVGLGVGTQLALAVGQALSQSMGLSLTAIELARLLGRGQRSGIGVHGFAAGGFLVDGGKADSNNPAPLLCRETLPPDWRIVLVLPPNRPGFHGDRELEAFQRLANPVHAIAQTDALCRLVLLGMIPALREGDLQAFSEAVFDFNARVGEFFAAEQGGVYANPFTAEVIAFLRAQGIPGAGQSSWGPTVFAIVEDESRASKLGESLRNHFALPKEAILTTRPNEVGARWEKIVARA